MKNLILAVATTTMFLTACNNNPKKADSSTTNNVEQANQKYACSMHPDVIGNKGNKCSKCGMELTEPVKNTAPEKVAESKEHEHDGSHHHDGDNNADSANHEAKEMEQKAETKTATIPSKQVANPLSSVYNAYFALTNALTKDDGKTAQTSAKTLLANISKIDANIMSADQKAIWTKFKTKLSFDAEHISGVDENEHQREHFVSLSKNMHEVMKGIKNDKPVYYQHCPMYDDNKGANWLSLESKISNPYLGKSMPTCGNTIETIK